MGIVKSRSALIADIAVVLADAGSSTAEENRELLENMVASFANIDDDYVPGLYSSQRTYARYDIAVSSLGRIVMCNTPITTPEAYDSSKWTDPEFWHTDPQNKDIGTGGSIDLSSLNEARHIELSCTGAAQSMTDIQGMIDGRVYRFTARASKTITFNHAAIGGASGGKFTNPSGANFALVGRAGASSDYAEYRYYADGDFFMLEQSANYV